MDKRACFSGDSPPRVSKCDGSNIDALLESLISVSDDALIEASFDGLVGCRSTDSDQKSFIQRALHLGSVLLEAGKRSARKRPSFHNALVWPLSHDLTIKVFSMLDTPSVCSAAASCTFFEKCAMDPLCYVNIDLATLVPKVNDAVASTMIQRAGNELQSVKLGVLMPDGFREAPGDDDDADDYEPSLLQTSWVSSLSANGGAIGSRLRRLHLYNFDMDDTALSASLSVCPSLVDLELVGLYDKASPTLESVSRHCRLLERFIYEAAGDGDDKLTVTLSACQEFVVNCLKITTLAIKRCILYDEEARKLVKGFRELKFVDFTRSACFRGKFLKNLGTKRGGGSNLEVIILRECLDLHKGTVEKLMEALVGGKFRHLRHLDISHNDGLAISAYTDDRRSYRLSSLLKKQLSKKRPNLCFVAEFPDDSDDSDHSSDCEDSEESNSVINEDSSDEEDNPP